MWAVASAYLFQDLLWVCLKCYWPNVVLLHCGVPVRLYYLPVWSFSWYLRNASRCTTYSLQVACTHKQLSVPHVELQEPARWKYKTGHVGVSKSMNAATSADHWSRWRHRLRLQLPLPLSLIPFCSSRSQRICNDRMGFWIRDGGRQVFKTAESCGSSSNAGCGAGYDATPCVCVCGSAGCWCVTSACTWCGGWSNYWPSLCSGRGGSHALSDICNTTILQLRWRGGVLTLDCRSYGTPSLRGIPLASRYGNASLSRGKLSIPRRPPHLLILMIRKTLNISYDRRHDRVSALGRHHPIWMFDVKTVGIISFACLCNGRRGRLLLERPWRDSTKKGGVVLTALDSKPWQYSGTRSLEKHSIIGLTAIRLNSD